MGNDGSHSRVLDEEGSVLLNSLTIARSLPARMRGLLGRDGIGTDEGLLLEPCRSIHMFGMRFPIDAVFLDGERRILKIAAVLQPGSLSHGPRGTKSVLEVAAGTAKRMQITPGQLLRIE